MKLALNFIITLIRLFQTNTQHADLDAKLWDLYSEMNNNGNVDAINIANKVNLVASDKDKKTKNPQRSSH